MTIEEHGTIGRLGSAVAEVLAAADGAKVAFKRMGLASEFSPHIGSQEYLKEHYGLTAEAIAGNVTGALEPAIKGRR